MARSRDLSGALATFACVCVLAIGGARIAADAIGWLQAAFVSAGGMSAAARDDSLLTLGLAHAMAAGLLAIAPVLAAGMVAGVLGSVGLGGLVLSPKALMPDFSRLSPLKGFGRILSLNGLVELGKSLLKVFVLGGVAAMLVWSEVDVWPALALPAVPMALAQLGGMMSHHALALSGALFVIAAADVPFQWWNHHKQLRMTLEEAKQENKETEGDPQVKGKIRQLQRERARARMMQAVPTADVVVTNPAHYAVALKYDDRKMSAPRVVAKGTDEIAARIRELAAEHGVSVVESPPLARALYRHAELEAEVPVELYRAVAQVLAYVYQLRGHAHGPQPAVPVVEVPAGWDPLDGRPRPGRAP
ncbi:flagellar biosynthesis protein FlhB [Pigmentiphaga soli]|uniref:Flagellar biosynthesis protein FlhB n=1 Tax=Pigmentiphaga soli TaxID=1007095 RepID=A0ABP8HTZ5_9BURK